MPENEQVMNAKESRANKSFLMIWFSDNQGALYKGMASNNKVNSSTINRPPRGSRGIKTLGEKSAMIQGLSRVVFNSLTFLNVCFRPAVYSSPKCARDLKPLEFLKPRMPLLII
jgi:hypothetical protein